MELTKTREEFINTVSSIFKFDNAVFKVPVKKKADDPETVGELINWFLTCDTVKLKTTSVAKWVVVLSNGNYELSCGNHQFNGKAGTLFIRPTSHNIIIGNSDVLSRRKQYGLDIITDEMLTKVNYILSFDCISETYNTAWIKVIQTTDESLKFNIDKTGFLFIRYNDKIPEGVTFKLSSDKLSLAQANNEVWDPALTPISAAIIRPCYIVPNKDKVVETKGDAQEYHYTELLKLIDEIAVLDFKCSIDGLSNKEKYGIKVTKQKAIVSNAWNTDRSIVNNKLNSLSCMVHPEYGSCRFTGINSNETISLKDGIGKVYLVTVTACKQVDYSIFGNMDRGHGTTIYVRGCISIKESNQGSGTDIIPILTKEWVKLIIPDGIKTLNEKETTKEN